MAGDEVTLEGFVHEGEVTVIGVTDSVKYPGTNSFERFEYPSALPAARLEELSELAEVLVPAHGLDACFFNIEFFVPESGPVQIVELNPRIASQFSPLVEAVHGRPTYDVLFALACGEDPGWDGSAPRGVAISYVVRVFDDALVEAVPEPQDDLEILVRPGLRLSEQGTNDTASYRLAIFTEWGETREDCRQAVPSSGPGLFASSSPRQPQAADERAGEREPGRDPHRRLERVGRLRQLRGASLAELERVAVGRAVDERDDDPERRDRHELSQPRDGRVDAGGDSRSSPPAPASARSR